MEPMKLDVLFAFFAYGGNGGIAMLLPEINSWFHRLALDLRDDPRIGRFAHQKFGDVPLTMERNRAVATAKAGGFDVLVMIDSDNVPDLYAGDPGTRPFFESSFDFLHERKLQGLPSCIAAPYCGPPPHPTKGGMENVYVFHAEDRETGTLESGFSFEAYTRQQASQMTGIVEMAAGPTGCIMYSLDAFDLMPIRQMTQSEILDLYTGGTITKERALRLLNMQSWFFYEYTDLQQTAKASTEDVTNTREIQLAGLVKHNQPVCFCNWDAWAGHYKPKCVGKPMPTGVGEINMLYQEAVENHLADIAPHEKVVTLPFGNADGEHADGDDEDQQEGQSLEFPHDSRVEIKDRMIGGRKVRSVGHLSPDTDMEALAWIVDHVAKSRPTRPLRIVEVGSWVGESAIAMHQAFGPAGGTVFCVDTWEGSPTDWTGHLAGTIGPNKVFEYFLQNVGDLIDEGIKVFKGDSVQVANGFEGPQGADIVFLDAAHDYAAVRDDIAAWLPHVADDGVLCGHDLNPDFPGVVRAVKELCDDAGITPKIIEGTNIWLVQKSHLTKPDEEEEVEPVAATTDPDSPASEG